MMIRIMVVMMLTVCWNLIGHCQGRTRLIVLVKSVLRKLLELRQTDRHINKGMEKIIGSFNDLRFQALR